MNIGIIGAGIVGNAIKNFFENNLSYNLLIYDKYKNINTFEHILNSDYLFLCLPTPYDEKLKEYNKSNIYEICELLNLNNFSGNIFLKSTVEPGTTEFLFNKYKLKIYHNPEFLSQKTAESDFKEQKHIVIGYVNNSEIQLIKKFFNDLFKNSEISIMTSNESELMKLTCNNFYAVKIQFFNEIYNICNKINCDYNIVKDAVIKNGWVNKMHTEVPGSDGKLSYGGACFPKDTNAFNSFLEKNKCINLVIKSTIEERNVIRD